MDMNGIQTSWKFVKSKPFRLPNWNLKPAKICTYLRIKPKSRPAPVLDGRKHFGDWKVANAMNIFFSFLQAIVPWSPETSHFYESEVRSWFMNSSAQEIIAEKSLTYRPCELWFQMDHPRWSCRRCWLLVAWHAWSSHGPWCMMGRGKHLTEFLQQQLNSFVVYLTVRSQLLQEEKCLMPLLASLPVTSVVHAHPCSGKSFWAIWKVIFCSDLTFPGAIWVSRTPPYWPGNDVVFLVGLTNGARLMVFKLIILWLKS